MNEMQKKIWDALSELSGEEVAQVLTNVHGLQILNGSVMHELIDLGLLEDDDGE